MHRRLCLADLGVLVRYLVNKRTNPNSKKVADDVLIHD